MLGFSQRGAGSEGLRVGVQLQRHVVDFWARGLLHLHPHLWGHALGTLVAQAGKSRITQAVAAQT